MCGGLVTDTGDDLENLWFSALCCLAKAFRVVNNACVVYNVCLDLCLTG